MLEQDLDTVILDPDFYIARTNLIISLIEEGRTDAAIHILKQSKLKFEPAARHEKPVVVRI